MTSSKKTTMPDTTHLGLPLIEAAQAQKHVTHNEALALLDTLVQLAVVSRSFSAPPGSPAEGDRYIVKAAGSGAFSGKDNQLAQFASGGWLFHPPKVGWLAFIADEGALVAWDGSAWVAAVSSSGDISELQNLLRLGVGTEADATNPFSVKLNNALWTAKTEAEGGDGTLRYKLSKENESKTLSFLFQDNFSGRAEIGLCGDDDFHFKVSPDGTSWIDALALDKSNGSARLNAGLHLAGDLSPAQITSDQNDYNPAGLVGASVLRLSSDAGRNITGLAGSGDGRIVAIVNVGANDIVLKDASASSAAANRFAFAADVTLSAKQCAVLWYDAADQRWKLLSGPQAGGGGGGGGGTVPADLDIFLAELALGLADALNAAQFLGSSGNRFADSFDALAYVDAGASTNLDAGTPGLLKPSSAGGTTTVRNTGSYPGDSNYTKVVMDTAIPGGTVVHAIGVHANGSQTLTVKIVKRNSAGNFDIVVSESFAHPGSGWADKTLSADYTVPASGTYYLAVYESSAINSSSNGTARAYKAGDVTGSGQSGFTEDNGGAPAMRYTAVGSTNNMTALSTALSATAAPSSMKVAAHTKHVDAITLNIDYKISVSRDGGTSWSYATLNDRFTANAIHVLESNLIDLSGQPSGTSIKWRIETDNNKMVETHGIYLHWT